MKERLDILLVNNGFSESRDKAKRIVMSGKVFVDGQLADKAGTKYDIDSDILVKGDPCPYVGRGGLKLEKAINTFDLNLEELLCVDMGASTGGFTDCMLQHGAKKVYSIDVGYGQLAYKLRVDNRVVNIEKTNIRYLNRSLIKEPVDFISIDVSFISTKHMFPVCKDILKEDGKVVSLIKPQFEAGREEVGKGGIVKSQKTHIDVIKKVINYAKEQDLNLQGITFSPIKGTKGNIEYLSYFEKNKEPITNYEEEIINLVEISHDNLNNIT